MSLATFKKKTQAKYHNNSVNEVQFSTVGAYRNQGRVGQSTQSRSLTGPNSNGTTLCSKNDNTVVKKASMNTNGMLMSRYRWLRRPYDAAQPLNSISLKPGAGNILYGSQDAYIERKRKEAMCCDMVTVTNFAHTLLSYNASSIAHSKNTIIGLVTPSSYGTGFTNQETSQSNVIILNGALGSSITTANMTTTLENAGYVKEDGSSYSKYNVGDNNTSNTVSLSDTTANYLNNLDLTATSTTTFTTFSLDGNVEINTSEHTVTLVDYELSQLATHVNTRKGSLLSGGDVFFANTGVLLQYGDVYTNTPNVTVPNIFGNATSNNDIEKVGVMAGLLMASGNADYELTTNDLQLLVYAIYYETGATVTTAVSISAAYTTLKVAVAAAATADPPINFDSYVGNLPNWPFPVPDPLTGQYFNGGNLVNGSTVTDDELTAFNRLAELQADQELARIILTYQYYKTQVFINWIGGVNGYKKTVETLTNSLVIDKKKNNLTMGELIRMGNLYNNAWTKRSIKTSLPMVAINLFYQLLNDYNEYGGNTNSHVIRYNRNGGYIKEDAQYSPNTYAYFSDWDDADTSFYDFFWVMVNDILYVNNSYPDFADRDAVLYQIRTSSGATVKTVKVSDVLAFKVNNKDVFAVPDKYIQMSTVMYANQAYQSTHSAASLPAMSFVNLENQSGSLTDFLTEWDKFHNSLTAVISNLNTRSSIPYAVPTIGDIISVNNSFYLVGGYSTSNTTRTSSYNSQLLTGNNLGDFSVYTLFGTISGITGTPSQILTALQYIPVSSTYVLFGSNPLSATYLSAGARELIADVINGSITLRSFTSIETTGPSTQTQGTLTATTLPISSRNSDIIAKATEVNNQFARLVTWVTTTIGGIYTGATTNIASNGFNYYQNATPPVNQIPVNTIGISTGSNTIQTRGILGSLYYFGALTGGGINFSLNAAQLERIMAIIYIWSSLSPFLIIPQLQNGIPSITTALQVISTSQGIPPSQTPTSQTPILTKLQQAANAIRTNNPSPLNMVNNADKLYTIKPSQDPNSGNVVSVPSNWYAIGTTPPGTPDNDTTILNSSSAWKDQPIYGNSRGLTAYGSTQVSIYHNNEATQHLANAQIAINNAQTALAQNPPNINSAVVSINSAATLINSAATSINSAYDYADDAYTAANSLSNIYGYNSIQGVTESINQTRTAKNELDTLRTTIAALQGIASGSQLTETVILTFMLQDDIFDENYLVTSGSLTTSQLTTLKTSIYTTFATGAGPAILAPSQERLNYETLQKTNATTAKNNATTQQNISYWQSVIDYWDRQVSDTTTAITTLTSTLTLLAGALVQAAQAPGQPGANDHLKAFVDAAVGNTDIKPLRSNNIFYIQRNDVSNNTSTTDLAYEYRNDSKYEPMTSIQKYYVNGLAILNADQSLFRSYARLSLLSQAQLFWTSELQSQLASIGEGGLSSYVDVINLLQTQLVVNVIETEAQLFVVKVLNAIYKLRRNSGNNAKLDYKALFVLYILLSNVIDFSTNFSTGIDFKLRTNNAGDLLFIKSDPEPVLVIDVNNSVQIDINTNRYIIDSFNSSVGSAFEITSTNITAATIETSNITGKINIRNSPYNGKVKIISGGGNYDLLIQNLANFFYVYTETSNKYINAGGAGGDYMFYETTFDDPDNTNTVYPIVYTSTSSIYSTYYLRTESFYLYNTISFAASQNPLVETNLNNILTQADDFTTAISNMKTTLAGGSNPNSVVTIGDVVRINGKFYVVQSNDANGLVVINKDDSSVSIKEGSTIHLVYKGDTATSNAYLDTPGPIGTSLLKGADVTTRTPTKDCCLLDIDKAFLDQNNQQKRCGSTNTCG